MQDRFAIERVGIRNFRSILDSEVQLGESLTYIVGPNGSGKTNFIDGVRFLRNGLKESLDKAVSYAGGPLHIVPAPARLPSTLELRFDWRVARELRGFYSLKIRFESSHTFLVENEECEVTNANGETSRFEVKFGEASGTPTLLPAGSSDRLYLVQASGLPEFREFYECIVGMQSTGPIPPILHTWFRPIDGDFEAFADRVVRLKESSPDRLEIIEEYMRAVLPNFRNFEIGVLQSGRSYLKFIEGTHGGGTAAFSVRHMSNGSVYLADMLIDLFSPPDAGKPYLPFLIEEPETGLHPGAIRVLRDAFLEASQWKQLIVTTHSPEFLDDDRLSDGNILAAYRDNSGSHISNLDPGTRSILRENLYTAGELLRQGLLDLNSAHSAVEPH
ncbi:MAG TPA: AAA family ATPase [Bryobacteraceae bacterium]|nr:AAA family ATPase [Bryobacteraceae bacterium]